MSKKTLLTVVLLASIAVVSVLYVAACATKHASDRAEPMLMAQMSLRDTIGSARATSKQLEAEAEARAGESQRVAAVDSKGLIVAAAPGEEIWVIARAPRAEEIAQPAEQDDENPGSGALVVQLPGKEETVPVPLKHTDVKAAIHGYIATVDVQQQFHNPYDQKIEAVYVFPLPQNAAVNEFVMTVGERRIRGIIREREEAEAIYREARRQGHVASLMTQQRPNIFTQKVANIEPGKQIDIDIRYFHTLTYADGWYTFVFPMVVGPRFNPPDAKDPIHAVARQGGNSAPAQGTTIQYLHPNERSGHDISLAVEINAGVEIEQMVSSNHAVIAAPQGGQVAAIAQRDVRADADVRPQAPVDDDKSRRTVTLDPSDSIPNKDFVLSFRVAGERIKSSVIVHEDERGKFFTLMIYPPRELASLPRQPMEMIFVLDCSGSMNGEPIAQAKSAVRHALTLMQPGDSFQIIQFSDNASQLGARPLEATRDNVRKGLRYLDSLKGSGGTMMIEGIKAALDFPHDPKRHRVVAFLTDGYIGNDAEILGEVHKRIGAARVFSFGVGSSPNRYLLDRMAKLGRGAVAYLGLNDDGAAIMDAYFQRVSHAAMTDLAIDFGPMHAANIYPRRLPDLFVGRPVILTGRYTGEAAGTIRITGHAGGEVVRVDVPVNAPINAQGNAQDNAQRNAQANDPLAKNSALPAVWARMQIAELEDQATYTDDRHRELAGEIKRVALEYSLMSAYTAFIAVDSQTRTAGDHGTTVHVPVPVPDGVKYDTTVQE